MNNEKINWLQTVISIVALFAAIVFYVLIKEKSLDDSIGWELVSQILPNLIAALITIVVVYFLFIRKGISSQKLMADEIVYRLQNENSNNPFFLTQSEASIQFDLKKHLQDSKEVLINGYSCRYLIAGLRLEIQEALLSGTNIRILLIKPKSEASSLLLKNQVFKEIEVDLQDALQRIEEIKKVVRSSNKRRKGRIEVRVVNWVPSCSMVFAIPKKQNGFKSSTLRLKIYAPDNGTPLTKIETHMIINKAESEVYEYFETQFYSLWNSSEEVK